MRIRTLAAAGAFAVAVGACQTGATASPSAPTVQSPAATTGQASPSAAASPSGALPSPSFRQLFPIFEAQGGSNLTGGAIVTEVEDGSSVVIGVVAPGVTEPMPAAIVEGSCDEQTGPGPSAPPLPEASPSPGAASPDASPTVADSPSPSPDASPSASPGASPGDVELPLWLTDIMAGSSNSVIPLSIDDLTGEPHSIIIETSHNDPTIVACADLEEGEPGAGASPSPSGDAGGASPSADATESPEASGSPASS